MNVRISSSRSVGTAILKLNELGFTPTSDPVTGILPRLCHLVSSASTETEPEESKNISRASTNPEYVSKSLNDT